jgi:hypothetical protein
VIKENVRNVHLPESNIELKTENGELRIPGIKRKITMVMFILLNNVTTQEMLKVFTTLF